MIDSSYISHIAVSKSLLYQSYDWSTQMEWHFKDMYYPIVLWQMEDTQFNPISVWDESFLQTVSDFRHIEFRNSETLIASKFGNLTNDQNMNTQH
jgi:hypothetical protein